MKFLLLMANEEGAWEQLSAAEQERIVGEHDRFTHELEAQNRFVSSYRLQATDQAKTVRRDDNGEILVTDGPFAETKETIGGLYIIEAESMEEALRWAEKGRFMPGANEVRPLWEG